MTTIAPSPHQEAILNAVSETDDNLLIQAAAGSGKTTTLRMIAEIIPPHWRVLAVAFNKAIAKTFKEKLPSFVDCRTLHSVGFGCIRKAVPDVNIEEKKLWRILEKESGLGMDDEAMRTKGLIAKIAPLVIATMTDPNDERAVIELADGFNITVTPDVLDFLPEVIKQCREDRERISFDDMLDHPLTHGYTIPTYDIVLCDEVQDFNAQQLEWAWRLSGEGVGRIIAVGDRHQSIYAFRGADFGAMDRIKDRFNCTELPLSVCYRCGTSIVAEAQAVVGPEKIQAAEGAHEGTVTRLTVRDYFQSMESLEPGDMVVCRTNAPLVWPCLRLIRTGRKAFIRGSDIGKGLVALVRELSKRKRASDGRIESFITALNTWADRKYQALMDEKRFVAAAVVKDQKETLIALTEGAQTVQQLIDQVTAIFADDVPGVAFSTIHRAKGLEAERVVILGPELIPHPMAAKGGPEAMQQEENLSYVARTRAISELIYQPIPG